MGSFLRLAGGFFLVLSITGCDLLFTGSKEVDIARPVSLHPEADIFSSADVRAYQISEGIIRTGKDTTFTTRSLEISHLGDTLIAGAALRRVSVETSPAPASVLALLGLNPTRLFFDTVAIPDPGPALRFPDTPKVGWSQDTTVGALRHVRRYTGVQNVVAAGLRQQCWMFKDSTYLNGTSVSTATLWMGATGLVLHRLEWSAYAPAGVTGGTFWREIRAAN